MGAQVPGTFPAPRAICLRAQTTVIPYDEDFVKAYFEMPDEEVDVTRMSPWLLRIELNREMMVRACGAVSVLP